MIIVPKRQIIYEQKITELQGKLAENHGYRSYNNIKCYLVRGCQKSGAYWGSTEIKPKLLCIFV